jgi:SAM-dependent methyltransferase
MSVRESHYRAKRPFRARGLADLERLVGGVVADIERCASSRTPVRVLELGCGYGTALLELRARYGGRVELHGVNREYGDGNLPLLQRNAAERGLDGGDAPWPTIAYADVAQGLPFADDRFDLVVSQVAWLYFGNKIGVVREVMRVLRDDGLAKIDADEVRAGLPAEYARLVEIWQDGVLIPFGDYLRRFGMALAEAPEGHYLRLRKSMAFGRDLVAVAQIDLSALHEHWDGVKCVYAVVAAGDDATTSGTSQTVPKR